MSSSKTNDILSLFQDEKRNVIRRGQELDSLLAATNQVLDSIKSLRSLHSFISPKSSQLHLKCKDVIQEKKDLETSYQKIKMKLGKKEELRSIQKRIPEMKKQVVTALNLIFDDYQKRQPDGTSLDEYFARFFIECRKIKDLTSQLEACSQHSNTEELSLYLEEIYTLYFDIREQLIGPALAKISRQTLSQTGGNICQQLGQACIRMSRILRNEEQLFYQIFPAPNSNGNALFNYLEILCRVFYDNVRPVILRVNHLETLAELYKLVVETELMEGPYQTMLAALMGDIKERMVFRTEVFIRESVLDYKPSKGDLAYPEKLEVVSGGELKDFQSMWYPTVQRTVLALYYLQRVFDQLTFNELAQEILFACLKSLDIAQRLIDERHGGTKIEASLFLSKHLAIISDQLQLHNIHKLKMRVQRRNDDGADDKLVEIESGDLESMLRLFQENEVSDAAESESLWHQLNETIKSGTRWTLQATRIQR